ncbi:MAG: hypothetical protein AAGM22_27355 [Acidobacteriota bacterium]
MNGDRLFDVRFLGFHALFLTVGTLLLVLPSTVPMGWRLFFAGVVYNIGFPVFAVSCVEPRWARLWTFIFPLSLLQIFPDWHLAQNLGTLVFPDLGFPQIGPVSLFMGLLWAVPLILIVDFGERLDARFGGAAAAWGAAAISLVIFGIAEATLTLIPVWHAQNVAMVGPVALYVLIPEAILGAAAWRAFRLTENRGTAAALAGALAVMLLYAASLHLSWWLLEA